MRGVRAREPWRVPLLGDPSDAQGMGRAIADYLGAMQTLGRTEPTLRDQAMYLGHFLDWCAERGVVRPSEVTRPVLERFQRHLFHHRKPDGNPISFRSQHSRLGVIRSFFRWLTRQNRILYNPASDLDMPKVERRLPRFVLSEQEAELVLQQPDLNDPLGLRDRAILEVFYSTGIRRFELAGLSLYDLDLERGTVMVRQGKGRRDRMVPIGERAAVWVEKYLSDVRPQLCVEPDAGVLFLSKEGESIGLHRLSEMARDYVDRAQIGKRGSCHLWRHTMATLMLEGGADIRFIQQMLGHAELSTTQIYTQVSIRKLKQVHSATHPGAANQRHRQLALDVEEPDTEVSLLSSLAAEAAEEELAAAVAK